MTALHVLLLPSWYPAPDAPQAGSFFREQALALVAAGHRVGVLAPHLAGWRRRWRLAQAGLPAGGSEQEAGGVTELHAPAFAPLPGSAAGRRDAVRRAGRQLYARYVAHHGRPDVLHVHSAIHVADLAVELAAAQRLPLVITEHSSLLLRGLLPAGQRRHVARAYAQAQGALAVSHALCARLQADFPRHDGWQCVPNLVDARFFASPLAATPAAGDRFVFLAVGLLDAVKGFDLLLPALARLPEQVVLRLGGDGPWRARLQAQAAALGLAGRVTFLGALTREQVVGEMSAAHGYVLSSRAETFGLVAAEALASGLPVVATRCGGPEDIVSPADGLLVPPEDSGALAAGMRRLVDGVQAYDRQQLRARCHARFAPPAIAAQLTDVYGRAIAQAERA